MKTHVHEKELQPGDLVTRDRSHAAHIYLVLGKDYEVYPVSTVVLRSADGVLCKFLETRWHLLARR